MASGNEKNHRVRVAQYLRMSTDHQQYSLHNQSEYIKDYAEKNNMEIAYTYDDAGKSGVSIEEIKESIKKRGLSKPISVRAIDEDDFKYALICGQGRIEALVALGETIIPAIIRDVSEEDAYVMSLVENIARRRPRSNELLQVIKDMKIRGLSDSEISEITDQNDSDTFWQKFYLPGN